MCAVSRVCVWVCVCVCRGAECLECVCVCVEVQSVQSVPAAAAKTRGNHFKEQFAWPAFRAYCILEPRATGGWGGGIKKTASGGGGA